MEIKKIKNLGVAVIQAPNNILDRYVSLSQSKKVREIAPNDLEKICTDVISLAYIQSGNNAAHPDDERLLRQLLYNDLKNDFPSMTGEEVAEAFRLGSKGEYGKVFGINSAAWNDWLRAFLKDPNRLLALKNIKEKPTEPSDEEKRNHKISFINLVQSMYLNHTKGLDISDHYAISAAYNLLLENKLIGVGFDKEIQEDATEMMQVKNDEIINKADKIKEFNANGEVTDSWNQAHFEFCKVLKVKSTFTKIYRKDFDFSKFPELDKFVNASGEFELKNYLISKI